MKDLFTADLHLGHANIIKFCNRPFWKGGQPDVDAMDQALISNINERADVDDRLWIVGDFAYRCHPRKLKGYFHAIRCQNVHLVPGNHDDNDMVMQLPWAKRPEMIEEVTIGNQRVVLCHYGLRTWRGIGKGAIHLFGHSHSRLPPTPQSIDVGVDNFNMMPVDLEEIRRRLKATPVHQMKPIEQDHHTRENL